MATPKSQRIGILIIALVMVVGTIGSFAIMVLSTKSSQEEAATQNQLIEQYRKQLEKERKEQSDKYYPILAQYKDTPAAFDVSKVGDKVVAKDLKVGTGSSITKDSTYKAYYIGWNPKGKVFDSSLDGKQLRSPLDVAGSGSLIKGWDEGVVGMKIGGIRELTIPSDLAYGEEGSGDQIPPHTPLKFIVMIVSGDNK